MFRIFRCGNNNAIDERSNRPGCFGNPNQVVAQHTAECCDNDKVTTTETTKEKSELDKLIDMIEASETANETETDDDEEWDVSCLLGESLLTNYSPDTVDTKEVLNGKSVVLLYFGNGDSKTLEMLKLFDAGYHHSVLSVVYCHDDLSAFVDMPARWFAAMNVAVLSASLGNVEEHCLTVIDPESGDVLCDNALDDIVALDSSDSVVYDEQATALFQSWIEHLPMQQSIIGEMTFEFLPTCDNDTFTQATTSESDHDSSDSSVEEENEPVSRVVTV